MVTDMLSNLYMRVSICTLSFPCALSFFIVLLLFRALFFFFWGGGGNFLCTQLSSAFIFTFFSQLHKQHSFLVRRFVPLVLIVDFSNFVIFVRYIIIIIYNIF